MDTVQKKTVDSTFRVRYAETDAMGVVYHANYLVWFEVGRGAYFRAMGQDYGRWEQEGYFLPVSEAYARYHAPACYGALITVQTWVEEARSRSVRLGYRVMDATSEACLVTGWTKHMCTDRQGRVRRLPKAVAAALTPHD
ncbi:acyl-CoA thioesterase [Chloroflexota bacterium]